MACEGPQGPPGLQGERGEPGARGESLSPPAVFYSLGDLNYIANGLDREFNGTWETYNAANTGFRVAQFTVDKGYIRHITETGNWIIDIPSRSADDLQVMMAGFLRALGVSHTNAEATAERIAARPMLEDPDGCQGPHGIKITTFDRNDIYYSLVEAVFSEYYDQNPSC